MVCFVFVGAQLLLRPLDFRVGDMPSKIGLKRKEGMHNFHWSMSKFEPVTLVAPKVGLYY